MKKVKNSNEIKIYRLLLSLYPKSYLKEYKKLWIDYTPGSAFPLHIELNQHVESIRKGNLVEDYLSKKT